MSPSAQGRLRVAVTVAVFAALFLFHTYPLGLGDIYWHLNTGRWIVDHHALPTSDPFLYTLPESLDQRQILLLQGYWLAQVTFYKIHMLFGDYGLVAFKAGLFAALYFILWRTLRGADADAALSLLALLPLPLLFYRYDELRPQIFSFIGTILMYACVARARVQLRAGVRWPPALLALPVIMLCWANLHRGYILGAVIMLVALGAEAWRHLRHCRIMDPRALRRYASVFAIALAASFANPMFADAYLIDLHELSASVYRGVDEFLPLWNYAVLFNQPALFFAPLILVAGLALVLFVRRRYVVTADWINFIGFAAAGFKSFRFMILGVLIALAVGMPQLGVLLQPYVERLRNALYVVVVAGALVIAYLGWNRSAFNVGPIEAAYVPERATDFILARKPPAPLFNPYEYGGYLGWKLGSIYKLFYDPRSMDNAVYAQYEAARDGRYQEVFARYDVRSVVFYLFTPVLDTVPTLPLALLSDARWDAVYADRMSIVFVRHEVNTLAPIDRARIWQYLSDVTAQRVAANPSDADAHLQHGRVLLFHGEIAAAAREFEAALRLAPGHRDAQRHLDAARRMRAQ